jgi:tetratricopeptide (TPR) repeat protein
MKILSTTLLGPGTSNDARDAIGTVRGDVDGHLLVSDPRDSDEASRLARELPNTTLRLEPWQDFSHARNTALRLARDAGADWAVTLDSDERLYLPPSTRDVLERAPHDVLFVPYQGGAYSKERLFRIPAKGEWVGPTHEAWSPAPYPAILDEAYFVEMPKTDEQVRAKCARDVVLLARYMRKRPKQARWPYYLGQSLQDLGRYREATIAYQNAYELDGWEEESALAAYRAAECYAATGLFRRGIECAALALGRAPWMPEPAYLAAILSLEVDKPHDAIAWAHLALAHGYGEGRGAHTMTRVGLQRPLAQWEGPYEALAEAYKRLGDTKAQATYAARAARAKAARTRLPVARPAPDATSAGLVRS